MRKIILVIALLSIILLVGCAEKKPISKTYIIKEPEYKTFTIGYSTGLSELKEMQKNTAERREQNNENIRTNEEIDGCIEKTAKNWKRVIDDKMK